MANDLNRSIKIYLDNSAAMTSADELRQRIGELESKLLDLQTAGKGNSAQAKKIEKELAAQTKKYENYKKEVADTERVLKNLSGATYNELIRAKKEVDKQLRSTTRNTDLYNKRLEIQKSISRELLVVQKEMRLEVASQGSVFSRANDFIGKYMGLIGTGIAAITGITMAFAKFRDERDKLESSSANLKALTGLDDENVKKLEDGAKRLSTTVTEEGVRIRQSAVEIDDSFAIIGSQRPELLKNAEALEKVAQDAIYLSIAGKDKLEPAAKALTTVMNQMNLGAENSRRIINAIAAGSQAGAGNIQYITDAFEKSGTTARIMNIELEQHIGLIEAVAPKYSEASIAGNSLDKVLLKMKEKGIGYKNGVFDLSLAIGELETKFKNGESAATLFGAEHAKMAEILVMNKKEIEDYTTAVTGTNKAVVQAQINSDTNEAKRAQARNKMNLLAIDLMEKLNPAIIGAMNQTVHWTGKLVTLATWVSENTTEILAVVIGLSAYTVAVKSAIIVDKLQVLWNEKIISSLKTMYATMLKNPYALMGAVVLTWLLYMRKANQELTKMEVVQRRLNKVETEAAQNIAEQKTELEQFLRVARDESESKERRLSALKKINELSPEYLGNLTLEEINTDKATTAINRYIDSIYAMAKAQAAKEQLVEIEKEKIRLDTDPEAFQEQIPWWEEMEIGLFGLFSQDKADQMLADMVARGRERRDKTKSLLDAQAEALRGIVTDSSKTVDDILTGNSSSAGGNSGKKVKDSEFKTAMDLNLKEMENAQSKKLALLKKEKLESEQTEQFYNLQVLSSDATYYQKRLEKLQDYLKKTSSKKMQAEINKQIVDVQTKQLEIEQKRDKEVVSALQDNRDKQLRIVESSYTIQKTTLEKAVAEQKITREQADALSLSLDAETADKRLLIYKGFQDDVLSLELSNGSEKAKAIEDANKAVLDADQKAAQARANQQKALQNLLKDFKDQFKLSTVGEETDLQLKVLNTAYQARKEMAEKANMDTLELDKAYERARTNILKDGEEKRNQVREQYGLLSMQDQNQMDLDRLKEQRDAELLSEGEYQDALLNMRIGHLKSYFDYYSELFSGAISALQEAELANIDAKYDAEIQRAGDNSEEVARLEKEKENKKLAVQKKYAGVNFAIKVSEIIANTAVAIMQAFAQLGPIAGAVAAALMGATGVAQIAVANAERKKVMNMTVDGSTSSGSGTGTRVASGSAGYYVGGWSGDGSPYEVAGPVHKKEYVVPSFVMSEPAAMNHVVALEAMRRQKTNANPLPGSVVGMANGGYSGNTPDEPDDTTVGIPLSIIKMLVALLTQLNRGPLKAYVVQSELQAEQDKLNESRKIGSKS